MGVKFTEYDVSRDERAAEEMVRTSGQMGVPVIVIDGEVIVGFNRARLQELLAGGKVRLGLMVADADRVAQKQGSVPVFGAVIGGVAPGSLGERAGLKPGDIITEINTRRITRAADVEQAISGLNGGSIVTVLFLRGNETRKSEIVA
jgi:membrane-associated protease RseP (regulator of RpoE activity)